MSFLAVGAALVAAMRVGAAVDGAKFFSFLDLSAPSSSAQSLLGLDPSKIDSPTKIQDWAVSYLRGNGSSAIADGFSVSVSTLSLKPKGSVNGLNWSNRPGFRLSNYTQLSAALVAGETGKSPGRAAVGLGLPILDETDWRADKRATDQYVDLYRPAIDAINATRSPAPAVWRRTTVELFTLDFQSRLEAFDRFVANVFATSKSKPEDIAAAKASVAEVDAESAVTITALNGLIAEGHAQETLPPIGTPPGNTFKEAYDAYLAVNASRNALQPKLDALSDDYKKYATDAAIKKLSESFEQQASAYYWNHRKLDLAVGTSWGAADNEYQDLADTGSKLWATYAMPVFGGAGFKYEPDEKKYTAPTRWNLLVHGGLVSRDRTFKDTAFGRRSDGYEAGLRIRGGALDSGVFAEGLFKSLSGGTDKDTLSWTLGYEKRLNKGQWFQVSIGSATDNSQRIVAGLGLSFNLSRNRELDFAKN